MDYTVDGRKVRAIRKSLGWSQETLAMKAEIGVRQIGRIERGETRQPHAARRIADALGVPIQEILIDSIDETRVIQEPSQPALPSKWQEKASCLILGAGPVPSGVGTSSTQLISRVTLLGRPILTHQIEYLKGLGFDHFVIGIPKDDPSINRIIEDVFPELTIRTLSESDLQGVGMSAARLAAIAQEDGRDHGLFVLGDTLFEFEDVGQLNWDKPFVLWEKANLPHRWATIRFTSGGPVFNEKDLSLKGVSGSRADALIGVYWFPSLSEFRHIASKIAKRPLEMSHILNELDQRVSPIRAGDWYDIGHADTYMEAQQSLLSSKGRETRRFNRVEIDPWRGTITKRIDSAYAGSRDIQRFHNEIAYYHLLPKVLRIYFPRVVAASRSWEDPFLTLEYYGCGTLADLYLFGTEAHPELWLAIFERIALALDSFHSLTRPCDQDAMRDMYLGKTHERLQRKAELGDQRVADVINATKITVNRVKSPGLQAALDGLRPKIEEMIERGRDFSMIVGDSCFSNVLFDVANGTCRFVDPRGSFGRLFGCAGDPAYDIAKLFHSVEGLYDSIVNDLFSVKANGTDFAFSLYSPPNKDAIVSYFNTVFWDYERGRTGASKQDILLINVLLFASMIPLHNGKPDRQLMMALRALHFCQLLHGHPGF